VRTDRNPEAVDAISDAVGYEHPASFRRPDVYRRKLQLPAFARAPGGRD
jgi:hypothetical protein